MAVPVIDITSWEPADEEPLGTKPKQWVRDPDRRKWLWKETTVQQDVRHGAFLKGDDWSEVLAGRVGEGLGLPVARVELAQRGDARGVISRSVLAGDEELAHGNELLTGRASGGSSRPRSRVGYTLLAVRELLTVVAPPDDRAPGLDAFDWFVGFVVLDALVGNTDRHQDNWGVIRGGLAPRLAPSFDHASCLGFLLSDQERVERLTGGDPQRSVAGFAGAATSKFEGSPLLRAAALDGLGLAGPEARAHLGEALNAVPSLHQLADEEIPQDRMSVVAREFAEGVYRENHSALSQAIRTMWS